MDLAATLGLAAFFSRYAANRSSLTFLASSSSDSEPNRSTSSSSSAAGLLAGLMVTLDASGPYAEASLVGSLQRRQPGGVESSTGRSAYPGNVWNSGSNEAMCLYQR